MGHLSQHIKISQILVLVAMDAEEAAILNVAPNFEVVHLPTKFPLNVKKLSMNRGNIILAKCGIGLVNAGVVTAIIAQNFQIDAIILLGVAGSLKPELQIGDMVLASSLIQHDSIYSGEQGDEMMAPGEPYVSLHPSERANPEFKTDSRLNSWLSSLGLSLTCGQLLSGSEFVGSYQKKKILSQSFRDALAVEMESAAVAMIATQLGIPFTIAKTIADRMNPDGTIASDYNKFLNEAAKHAAKIISHLQNNLND